MLTNARHAFRRWSRRPAFTTTAILTLALGIGATTAIFSVADVALLRPVPWPEPDRLVAIYTVVPEQRSSRATQATWNQSPVSWPTWQALASSPAFAGVGAWTSNQYTEGRARTEFAYANPDARPIAHAIVGVLPPSFRLKEEAPDFVLPTGLAAAADYRAPSARWSCVDLRPGAGDLAYAGVRRHRAWIVAAS